MTHKPAKDVGPACGQCQRPAVVVVESAPLCVDCYHKFEVARTLAFRVSAIGLNFAAAEMDHAMGAFGAIAPTPRIQVPDLPKGPMILHHIKVENSIVASINTGNVQTIDVNLTYLANAGNDRATNALKAFTQAILEDTTLSAARKNELIEQVAFLTEQTTLAAKDRKPGLVKPVMSALKDAANTITALTAAWQAAEPIVRSIFGF